MTMPDATAVREVFRQNMFCVIATASLEGDPWLSPVFYNYSPDYTLVWESAHDAQHSHNIRLNEHVAVFIKDASTTQPGLDVYIEALAQEVPPERLAEALSVWEKGPHGHSDRPRRELEDYGPSKPLRLYQAQIQHLYVRTETQVDGYRVDSRLELDLDKLSEGATRREQ